MPALATVNVSRLQRKLLGWFDEHQRPLPWRATRSPFRIWVSEIMLQQTRVAAVVARYQQFLKRFPDVRSLSRAKTSDVLAAWSGLGYYRRARSAHKTARLIVSDHGGSFPRDREQLCALPGIGEYTSAAIASIAFGAPHAVVDGNVRRVLERLTGKPLSHKEQRTHAQALLSESRPGDFNQAMMELGAVVCTPEPRCDGCPVFQECGTRGKLQSKRRKVKPQKRKVCFVLSAQKNRVFLVQRSRSESLMPEMWELPADDQQSGPTALTFRHSITNTDYLVSVTQREQPPMRSSGKWIPLERLEKIPLTGLARKILRQADLL